METGMETDIETDMETEMDKETEMESYITRTCTWNWGTLAKYLIWSCSKDCHWHVNGAISNGAMYFVTPLRYEQIDTNIFYRHWDCSLNDVLAELEWSVWG
jgi:hypothetical protein